MAYRFCFFLIAVVTQTWALAQKKNFTVTAYYAGSVQDIEKYDPTKLTHIIFSFAHLKGNKLHVDSSIDTLRIQKLVALKKRSPTFKVLLSLGGWGGCASCSDVFSTDAGRKEFASSVKSLGQFFSTDGIDLDWEYPAIEGYPGHKYAASDKENFTQLIVSLRDSLGTNSEISFAAGGFQKFIDEAVDWAKVMPLINRVNVMTYDLVNGYATTTGHHTALYSTARQKESTHNAVTSLLQKGVPASKIVIGAAFYGRVWKDVSATNNGLYQSGTFKSSVAFKEFAANYSVKQGFKRYWDNSAKAPYLHNPSTRLFVTYDDRQSLTEKTAYALKKGLNGIMFWELSHDLPNGGLLDAIHQTKKSKQ